jgi:cytochrome c oxidase cbb3-type subunit III
MSKQDDPLLSHEYDGIHEYDNPTPGWWIWIFAGTAVFSALYFIHYVLGSGTSIEQGYQEDVTVAAALATERALAQGEATEASLLTLMKDPAGVAVGKAKFQTVCAACHKQGEGGIGPNLTDDYWIHGKGTLMDIHQVIRLGVVEKGMAAWEKQMAPDELMKVTAYVGTLRGLHLPGKEPQGEEVESDPE